MCFRAVLIAFSFKIVKFQWWDDAMSELVNMNIYFILYTCEIQIKQKTWNNLQGFGKYFKLKKNKTLEALFHIVSL